MARKKAPARRPKGAGSIKRDGDKYRGRKRVNGQDLYTPQVDTWEEANRLLESLGRGSAEITREAPVLGLYYKALLLPPDDVLNPEDRRPDLDVPWRGRLFYTLDENTWKLHSSMFKVHIAPSSVAKLRLDEITKSHLQRFITDKRSDFGSAWSVRRLGSCIRVMFENAIEDEIIRENPADRIKYPKLPENTGKALTDERVRDLPSIALKECSDFDNPRQFAAMIIVGVDSGMRRGEVCAVEWADVDHEHRRLIVRRQAKRRSGGAPDVDLTKTGKNRLVELTEDAYDAIMAQPRASRYIFPSADGRAYKPDTFTKQWSKLRARVLAGFDEEKAKAEGQGDAAAVKAIEAQISAMSGVQLRHLRHTAVTLFVEEGDLKSAQVLAGHSHPGMTQQVYLQSRDSGRRSTVDKVAQRIGKRGVFEEAQG
jgi:integrase